MRCDTLNIFFSDKVYQLKSRNEYLKVLKISLIVFTTLLSCYFIYKVLPINHNFQNLRGYRYGKGLSVKDTCLFDLMGFSKKEVDRFHLFQDRNLCIQGVANICRIVDDKIVCCSSLGNIF